MRVVALLDKNLEISFVSIVLPTRSTVNAQWTTQKTCLLKQGQESVYRVHTRGIMGVHANRVEGGTHEFSVAR